MSMKEIGSNAEWQLLTDDKGDVYVTCMKTRETKPLRELANEIQEMKSLIALIEGRGVKIA